MISSAEIKFVKSLSQKKFRDSSGLFTVEGDKMVSEALASGFTVEKVYRRDEIGSSAMERMSALSSPSPSLALVRKREEPPYSCPSSGLFLALDGIRDPGNLGTIVRLSSWYGIDGIFASPDTVELYNPKVVQATMGAIFKVRFMTVDIPSLCRDTIAAGGNVYGTFLDGSDIYSVPLDNGETAPAVIVIGNEASGICAETASCVSSRLFIPRYPAGAASGPESLNAAVATAITVAEFRRRARR